VLIVLSEGAITASGVERKKENSGIDYSRKGKKENATIGLDGKVPGRVLCTRGEGEKRA